MYELGVEPDFWGQCQAMGKIFLLLLLLLPIAWCGLLIFSKPARARYRWPWTLFTKEKPKLSNFEDAIILTGALIGAAVFTLFFLVTLVTTIADWLK